MAVHTPVPARDLDGFLAEYGLPPASMAKGIAEGIENTNYLVESGGRRFILTLYEARVSADDLPYFLSLMTHTAEAGLPVARAMPGTDGEALRTLMGRPAALVEFLPGTSPDAPTAAEAEAAGAAMARLHLAAQAFGQARANDQGPVGWRQLANTLAERMEGLGEGVTDEVERHLAAVLAVWPQHLPRGTIHADLFPDNVLYEGGAVTGLIDFYFACTDFFAYDVAVALNAWVPEPGEGEAVDARNALAFLSGYERIRKLTESEREALPVLARGAAMRFFLTRTQDWLAREASALVRVKDPLPYLRLARHHASAMTDEDDE